jgi:hypothetical protein
MSYIVPEITLATRADIVGILCLQEQNLLDRGGLLSVRLPGAFIEAALNDLPQIVARRDGKIVGYLLAGSRGVHAQTPIIQAMFRAYPGSQDAYVYGPICVAWRRANAGMGWQRLCSRTCASGCRGANASHLSDATMPYRCRHI